MKPANITIIIPLINTAGYEEKFYFSPGNTGFKVYSLKFIKITIHHIHNYSSIFKVFDTKYG